MVWLFADKIIRQGLNFLITIYIARYLGAELFGMWNYAIAFVVMFSFFSTLGLYNQLLRDFVRFPKETNELLGSAFLMKIVGAIVTILLSSVFINIFKPGESFVHLLIFLVSIGYLVQAFDVIDFFFQSQLKAEWIAKARIISFLIFGIIKLSLILFQFDLPYFVAAQLGELALAALLLYLLYNKHYATIASWKINLTRLKLLLLESLPLFFAEIAILIYMRIDQIMIGEMLGNKQLGVFSAAVRLSEVWYFIPLVICSSFFPSIIESHSRDQAVYKQKLQKLYDLLIWTAIGISILVSFLSKYIILALFGGEFIEAAAVLTVHIWTGVFVFIGFASNQQLVVEQLSKISLYRTILGLVINVGLNLILIPVTGLYGAALGTLVSQAVVGWVSNWFFPLARPIFTMVLNSFNPIRIVRRYLVNN